MCTTKLLLRLFLHWEIPTTRAVTATGLAGFIAFLTWLWWFGLFLHKLHSLLEHEDRRATLD